MQMPMNASSIVWRGKVAKLQPKCALRGGPNLIYTRKSAENTAIPTETNRSIPSIKNRRAHPLTVVRRNESRPYTPHNTIEWSHLHLRAG